MRGLLAAMLLARADSLRCAGDVLGCLELSEEMESIDLLRSAAAELERVDSPGGLKSRLREFLAAPRSSGAQLEAQAQAQAGSRGGQPQEPQQKGACCDMHWDSEMFGKCHYWGDPHFTKSFTGRSYDLFGLGVYQAASSKSGDFEVQNFQCPFDHKTTPTLAVAIGVRLGGTVVVVSKDTVWINGTEVAEGHLQLWSRRAASAEADEEGWTSAPLPDNQHVWRAVMGEVGSHENEDLASLGDPVSLEVQQATGFVYRFKFADGTRVVVFHPSGENKTEVLGVTQPRILRQNAARASLHGNAMLTGALNSKAGLNIMSQDCCHRVNINVDAIFDFSPYFQHAVMVHMPLSEVANGGMCYDGVDLPEVGQSNLLFNDAQIDEICQHCTPKPAMCSRAIVFVVSTTGSNSCPAGSAHLTAVECAEAARHFGHGQDEPFVISTSYDPTGCFVFEGNQKMYYNKHQVGAPHEERTPYCGQYSRQIPATPVPVPVQTFTVEVACAGKLPGCGLAEAQQACKELENSEFLSGCIMDYCIADCNPEIPRYLVTERDMHTVSDVNAINFPADSTTTTTTTSTMTNTTTITVATTTTTTTMTTTTTTTKTTTTTTTITTMTTTTTTKTTAPTTSTTSSTTTIATTTTDTTTATITETTTTTTTKTKSSSSAKQLTQAKGGTTTMAVVAKDQSNGQAEGDTTTTDVVLMDQSTSTAKGGTATTVQANNSTTTTPAKKGAVKGTVKNSSVLGYGSDQSYAHDDPHIRNLAQEEFSVYQRGNHTMLRVPLDAGADPVVLIRASIVPSQLSQCAMYIRWITVEGAWLGNKTIHVRPLHRNKDGSNSAGDRTLWPFSLAIAPKGQWPHGKDAHWISFADLSEEGARGEALREEVSNSFPPTAAVAAARRAEFGGRHESESFVVSLGPPGSRATVVAAQASHQALNADLAGARHFGQRLGGLLGTEKHDKIVEQKPKACKSEKAGKKRSPLLLASRSQDAQLVASTGSRCRADWE